MNSLQPGMFAGLGGGSRLRPMAPGWRQGPGCWPEGGQGGCPVLVLGVGGTQDKSSSCPVLGLSCPCPGVFLSCPVPVLSCACGPPYAVGCRSDAVGCRWIPLVTVGCRWLPLDAVAPRPRDLTALSCACPVLVLSCACPVLGLSLSCPGRVLVLGFLVLVLVLGLS